MTVEEKYSRHWVRITVALAIGTVLFLMGYSAIENVLWKGILRLIAFGFLAATVFSALKVMQGKHTIQVEVEDGSLTLTYSKNNRAVSRDVFELATISKLYIEKHDLFFGRSLFSDDLNLRFEPSDSDRPLNLVEVNGRPLALTKDGATKIIQYIQKHAPNCDIPDDQQSLLNQSTDHS